MQATADSLQHACSSWVASYDSLKKNCAPAPGEERDGHFYMRQMVKLREAGVLELQARVLPDFAIRDLRGKGLADPVEELRSDLRVNADLIPLKPHGQRWQFGTIIVLSPRWVFANFEDGHYMGSCLLEYDVLSGGKIRWRVLKAELL
jgi:hypothetical protein